MLLILRRRFWVIGLTSALLCTFFAGRAVAHVMEAAFLTDSTHAAASAATPPPPPPAAIARSKSGASMVSRNLFCSTCVPAVVATTGPASALAPGKDPPPTSLPLHLIATFIGSDYRMATVQNTSTQAQGGYLMKNEIPGAGPIVAIDYTYCDFQNRVSGRVERISLLDAPAAAAPTAPTPVAPVAAVAGGDPMSAAIDAGVHKIDDTNYDIDRSLVDQVLANPMAVGKGARVMPSIKNGQPDGMRLTAVRPGSVYAKLGLASGDTIHAINGNALDSLATGLEIYDKVKNATSLQLDISHNGQPVTMHYNIK